MSWLGVLAVILAAAAGWWWGRRRAVPQIVEGPSAEPARRQSDGGTSSVSDRTSKTLLAAFRSDETPIAPDSHDDDRRPLVESLQLLAEHLGAHEAVLWKPYEEDTDQLLPVVWSRGAEPPALTESERAIVEWSAQEGIVNFNKTEPDVRLLSAGVKLGELHGAVSVHYRSEPAIERPALSQWLQRHAKGIADLHFVLQTRAESARSNNKLRAMVRTATTLQASRDPEALEVTLVRDTCVVTGAAWTVLVRWDPETRTGEWGRASDDAPVFGVRCTARQGSLVGDVCLSGKMKVVSDTRLMMASGDPVFDNVPLPSGTRSLLVVPIRRSDQESAVGALVCGDPERGRLKKNDAAAARDLAVIAAGALETAWAVREEILRARTDELTGLSNRRHFDEKFTAMINETDRYGGSSALVLLDIDFFKKVNDTYGHEAGDAVLIALGDALLEARRTTDFVARLGGEELALLLPQTDQEGALEVAERLRAKIEEMRVPTSAGELNVTASFGVAMYRARSANSNRLFERADKALYAAKHGGRNRVELAPADAPWSGSG